MLHHIIFIQHVLKMSSASTNASGGHWRHSPTVHLITSDPEWLTHCWCVFSIHWHTILKRISLVLNA